MFLQTTAGASMLGALSDWAGLLPLSPAMADDARVTPELVQLRPEIEPLVRLIEETPREKCLAMAVDQLRHGVPYRQLLSALFLAGIRNVNPQPPGFKFHCVFVIHSAHQLSLDAPAEQRLLPLFWALDDFKVSQQKDVDEGDFRLQPVTGTLPPAERAWDEFHAAMDAWDQGRADRAIVALVRSRGAHEIIEGLWRYGARDFRNIGHKAIFVANVWRTLQTIGWQHAEPALRSLVLGLLDFGLDKRVNDYIFADQAYLPNLERAVQAAASLPGSWAAGPGDSGLAEEVLATIRTGQVDDACRLALAAVAGGRASAASVWDAVHLAAGELMLQQPGIFGIHTVTSSNALNYAFRTSASAETRLLLMLQGVGWMTQFRNFMAGRPEGLSAAKITELVPEELPAEEVVAAEQILSHVKGSTLLAAREALVYAQRWPELGVLAPAARRLVLLKGTDAHDYKYPTAVFEDYQVVSPRWRPQILATAAHHLHSGSEPDSPVIQQARELAAGL